MRTVTIKPVGNVCNLRCTYCFNGFDSENRSYAPEQLAAHLSTILINKNVHFIISGGEPLLYPKEHMRRLLLEVKNFCGDKSCVQIQTNGLLLDDEWCSLLKECSQDLNINISVSFDPVQGNQRVDAEEWAQCKSNIQNALAKFPRLGVVTVLHKKNIAHIVSFYEQLRNMGVRNNTLNKFRMYPATPCPELFVSEEEYVDSLLSVFSWWVTGRCFDGFTIQPLLSLCFPETGQSCMYGAAPTLCEEMCVVDADGVHWGCENYHGISQSVPCHNCSICNRCGGALCCYHDETFCEARKKLFKTIDGVMDGFS